MARRLAETGRAELETKMPLRVARGLFRLWIVVAALWIVGVGATTNWDLYLYYQPTLANEEPPGRLQSPAHICSAAKTSQECSALLQAAGKFPYDANDLKWSDKGWEFADNTIMVPTGIAWERFWPRAGLAFIPPVGVLVIGSAFGWAVRGFR